ncbi:MAG: nucleotidyltransferase domain-containing protein [Candidatus Bathyarchaeota archaeon]|nr:MAG: nucleotidyltransferase domain-containing protein [Candidatus Bathyarchaeota archaeon]
MAKKPARHPERLEAVYGNLHWKQLERLRSKAINLMTIFEKANLHTLTHGSIARGDVTQESDIDIIIPNPPSSFKIETILERANIQINKRILLQATPSYAVKGYIEIDENESVSFPLAKMRNVERDFYRFGGEITHEMLKKATRVAGVDKRLMLIEPTEKGHIESNIIGREEEIAMILGISAETVLDRVHALLRRDRVGRTGVFIKREISLDETFELALKRLADSKPEVRRRLSF